MVDTWQSCVRMIVMVRPRVCHWPVVRPWIFKHQLVSAAGLPQFYHRSTTDLWSDRGNWSINTFLPRVYHWPVVRPWKLKHQHVPAAGLPLTRGQTVEIEASTHSCRGSTTDPWSDRGNWGINTFLPGVYHWPVVRPWKLRHQHVPAMGLPLTRGQTVEIEASTCSCRGRDLARILKVPVQIRYFPKKCLSWGQAASAAREPVTAGGLGAAQGPQKPKGLHALRCILRAILEAKLVI